MFFALAFMACSGGDDPVQLVYRFDAAPGQAFSTTLSQSLGVRMGDHAMDGTRELHARYRIMADAPHAGHDLRAIVRLDTVRASLIWGPNEQRIDTRHLAGREFALTVAPNGGEPTYDPASLPTMDMGQLGGGSVAPSLLIDYGFPTLPAEPVSTGSTWSETRTSRRLEATIWVTANVETTYRVTGREHIDGTRCLTIASASTGTLSDGNAHGDPVAFTGQLHGTAHWCFDAESGVLVRMTGEEITEGSIPRDEGAAATVNQSTKIEIHHVAGERGYR